MSNSTTQKILDAMVAGIKSAIGTSSSATYKIADANIVDEKLPWIENDSMLPGVILTPVPELEKNATNASDDIGYGVQVTVAQSSNRDLSTNRDRIYWLREKIAGLYRNRRLAVSGVGTYICSIEPKPVIDVAAFVNLFDATAFVVRVWVRTQRPTS